MSCPRFSPAWSHRQAQRRSGTVGSLLLGAYDEPGLVRIGHAGTGFTDGAPTDVRRRLTALRRSIRRHASIRCVYPLVPVVKRGVRHGREIARGPALR
ncbi:hypothetical protein [Saccharothrix yanglingensis]|uniref:DNA ligase (ATP) n=1 Tax=Saccharothrix yanglingensis TaxID=659496 RepID=A0ABU0WTQ8_9PSEU|nr:hypothetical protein [Saccharothrix yanglingensis]